MMFHIICEPFSGGRKVTTVDGVFILSSNISGVRIHCVRLVASEVKARATVPIQHHGYLVSGDQEAMRRWWFPVPPYVMLSRSVTQRGPLSLHTP